MGKSDIKPSAGRIVRFVPREVSMATNGAAVLPAIVVRTWENTSYENDEVNLKVFNDGEKDLWETSVPYSKEKEPRTWHWPERD